MNAPTLGDVGPHDDGSYTGDVSTSILTLDYYREKAREFQVVLNSLDIAYQAAADLMDSGYTSEGLFDDLWAFMDEFAAKKSTLKLTAEAINAGSTFINSVGGRFPQLSIPTSLGLGPFAVPVATIAAIATAATLATWAVQWMSALNERLKAEQLLEAQNTPEAKAALARSMAQTEAALRQTDTSVWSAAGGAVKWIAFAALGFFAWKAWQEWQKRKR